MRNGLTEMFGQLKYFMECLLCKLNVPVAILEFRGANAIKFQLKLLAILFFVFINIINVIKLKIYIGSFDSFGELTTVTSVVGVIVLLAAELMRFYFAFFIIKEAFSKKIRVSVVTVCISLTIMLDSIIALIINYVIASKMSYPAVVDAAHKVVLKYVESI